MKETPVISPFQLTALLIAGRLFSMLTWTPPNPEAGSVIAAVLIAPVVQFALALLLVKGFQWLSGMCKDKFLYMAAYAVCWAVCLVTAAVTAGGCGDFLSQAFYDGGRSALMMVILVGAAVFAVYSGLSSFARAAPIAALLAICGIAVLCLGSTGGMRLSYLTRFNISAEGTAKLILHSTLGNFELLALPLLQGYTAKKLRRRAIAFWLGLSALSSLAVIFSIMLSLGHYAAGREFPVLSLARSAVLPLAERLDSVLMCIWVLLGFIKVSVCLWLACELWKKLFRKKERLKTQALHGVAACFLAVLLLAGCSGGDESIGEKTIVTMLEIEPQKTGLALRVEYRRPSGREGDTLYGVYEGFGDSLWSALGDIERRENARLHLDNCRSLSLVLKTGDDPMPLLEELNTQENIRPVTGTVVSRKPLLKAGGEKKISQMAGVVGLFEDKGGSLGRRYTLKDALACARDSQLALIMPLVSKSNDRLTVDNLLFFQAGMEKELSLAEAGLLPLFGRVGGSQRIILPKSGASVEVAEVYSSLKISGGRITMTIFPMALIKSELSAKERQEAATELGALCRKQAEEIAQRIIKREYPDIFGIEKFIELTQPQIPKDCNISVIVKPIIGKGGQML